MPSESSESEENEIESAENAAVWEESEKAEQDAVQKAKNGRKVTTPLIAVIAVLAIIIAAATLVFLFKQPSQTGLAVLPDNTDSNATVAGIKTFSKTSDPIELIGGKPVIRLFSTTWCPHCQWISKTFDETVQPYVAAGKIVALHWELDIMDDTLTEEVEGNVPQPEYDIFTKFNPQQSIPTFVFGGKYYRIGNGYERQNDLAAEKAEFKAVIEALLKELEEKK